MSSDEDIDVLVATLRAAFPTHSNDTVAKALKAQQYDVDATAAKLLLLPPDDKGPQDQQPRRRSTRFSGQAEGSGPKLGWQALTEQRNRTAAGQQAGPVLGFSGQSKAPVADSLSFPALTASSSTTSCSPAKPSTPEKRPQQASRKFVEITRPHSLAQQPNLTASNRVIQTLLQTHTWASKELVQDLLREVKQDAAAADFLLRSMAATTEHSHVSPSLKSDAPITPISTPEGTASDRSTDDAGSPSAQSDIYRKHRRAANQLTRKWRKAVQHAAAGYASGNHSDARRASRQAQHSREAALVAHEKAARLIEQEHNEARGLGIGVLDLHGLHAREAVAAVDRRLEAIRGQRQGPGHRQELQIIVGIGSHSSEGEGSLGRVIESHLLGCSQAFRKRGGVIVIDAA